MKQLANELLVDVSSINSFASSYHKIQKVSRTIITTKQHLPPLNNFILIDAKINSKPMLQHILQNESKSPVPIFTFQAWGKLKNEVRVIMKKYFHQKLKEINSGNILIINPGESINVRTDYFCLSPHCVYTLLIPLQKCDINTGTIAVSQNGLKWQGDSEEELLVSLQDREMSWQYAALEEGDIVLIGRDCIYGSFRNDSNEPKYFVEMRWVKHNSSSSSSNSSS